MPSLPVSIYCDLVHRAMVGKYEVTLFKSTVEFLRESVSDAFSKYTRVHIVNNERVLAEDVRSRSSSDV